MALKIKPARFPLRQGNEFEVLVNGRQFFPAMLAAIESANHYICLEMYLASSGIIMDKFIQVLSAAAQRGLQVHLLLDDFGARRLLPKDRNRLSRGGVDMAFYNPVRYRKWVDNFARDHRKLLIVDGEQAFVGGAGLTDAFMQDYSRSDSWRETMIRIRGPVLQDWLQVFRESWRKTGRKFPSFSANENIRAQGAGGQVLITRGPGRKDIQRVLLRQIRQAQYNVWLSTAYFIPARSLRVALRRAAQQGVDVRLLLPGRRTDHPAVRYAGRRFYTRLLRDGVRIYEYGPRMLHSKVVLVDDWCTVGSSNFDRWNLRWNLEANQAIEGADLAAQLRDMFEVDFKASGVIDWRQWQRRGVLERLLEFWWARVGQWLYRFGAYRKFPG
ncbi:MAG: phosphatidylserine/phosphatidylglycerophosphate/cardiolipin synthase family protein [Gammaproteobacteria bacterium]|nr:MAG: phosphatidylserine/phosphatidylglycerophosphate/cardiolipin synthase family protein [Gammaproteobacteria bacterium]